MRQKKTKQIWRNIKDYGGKYSVSNYGNVRNNKTKRILKNCNASNGYKVVCLSQDSKCKTHYVHRLVADAFIEEKKEIDKQINHIDENKVNNNVNNLEWCSIDYNIRYSRAKPITGVCADNILVMYALTDCKKFGYNPSTIYNAIRDKRKAYGYSWEYINKNSYEFYKKLTDKNTNIIVI